MHNNQPMRNPGWIWGAVLIGVGLFLLRYGYGFGFSDQDEFLPLAAHVLDKDIFLSDWFVSMQFEGFSIRWPMALLVALPSTLLPVWSVVFMLHLGTALTCALAVGRLAHRIFQSRTATLFAVVAVMAVTTRWNPGGNDILHVMLVPSSVAWCLILSALERMHAHRFLPAGILLGAASLFHPLLGLQAGGLLVLVSLSLSDVSWKHRIRLAAPFLAVLVPLVVLLSSVGAASEEATFILTHLRAPHHYLPASFSIWSWFLWSALVLTAAVLLMRDANDLPRASVISDRTPGPRVTLPAMSRWDRAFLGRVLLVPTFALLVSLLVTAWPLQWPLALRLQPWAVSPLVRVVAVLTLTGFLTSGLRLRMKGGQTARFRPMPNGVLVLVGMSVLIVAVSGFGDHIPGTSHPDRALHEWARQNTDRDAVFVIPPSMSGFQYGSSRAQYVSFKSFPFAPEPTLTWWNRLRETAPVDSPFGGGTLLLARLDSAYVNQGPSEIRPFVATRDVDYIVRPLDDPADWQDAEQPEWCGDRWCVYWAGRILTQPARPSTP